MSGTFPLYAAALGIELPGIMAVNGGAYGRL